MKGKKGKDHHEGKERIIMKDHAMESINE